MRCVACDNESLTRVHTYFLDAATGHAGCYYKLECATESCPGVETERDRFNSVTNMWVPISGRFSIYDGDCGCSNLGFTTNPPDTGQYTDIYGVTVRIIDGKVSDEDCHTDNRI